ncbi:MAG: hypothetical protein CYPHOPRED_005713 [Cyphobasidiales sp. Tagirdzhanova-0007]|nr:MAG: hypothetical protein CYPHOPRED_005713 [Cyphobasidiales sp. Tagirdzhanova-0007]
MSSTNGLNGKHSTQSRPFRNGVYAPVVTPFSENEELDIPMLKKQVVRLANAGMGIVLLGTNGEDSERSAAIKATREALDGSGHEQSPILVGTGTGSTKETIKLCREAKDAGADYAIVIFPGYFAFAMGKNKAAISIFFSRVLDSSPLPVMIYNFPGAAAGVDLNSDEIIELSEHPNCFGAKLTCAGIGKGLRIAAHTQSKEYRARHGPFHILPGYSDYLLPALVSGQTGCITGTGNVFPKLIVKLYEQCVKAIETGDSKDWMEATRLQAIVAKADWCIVKAGIGGTKYAMNQYIEKGLGGYPRSPIPEADQAIKTMCEVDLQEALEIEKSL